MNNPISRCLVFDNHINRPEIKITLYGIFGLICDRKRAVSLALYGFPKTG